MPGESSPDNWYPREERRHPLRPLIEEVLAPTASSWCKEQCTVPPGQIACLESFCKDQYEYLTKADENIFLCYGDIKSVGLLRVLPGEQRGNWHSGELLHENDYSSLIDNSDACILLTRRTTTALSALCRAFDSSRCVRQCILLDVCLFRGALRKPQESP